MLVQGNNKIFSYDPNYLCGISKIQNAIGEGRIVGGKEVVPPHAHPWIVTLSKYKYEARGKSHGSFGCGGTLVSRKHVLSAAHCARTCDKPKSCWDKPVNWATLGDHDKRINDGEIYVKVTKPFHIHPGAFQPSPPNGGFMYDYVIFVLECCVTFNTYIEPACFPTQPHWSSWSEQWSDHWYNGQMVTVLGWGHTKFQGSNSATLQSINISVRNDQYCASRLKMSPSLVDYDRLYLMCASAIPDYDKDACQNDSGGKKNTEKSLSDNFGGTIKPYTLNH